MPLFGTYAKTRKNESNSRVRTRPSSAYPSLNPEKPSATFSNAGPAYAEGTTGVFVGAGAGADFGESAAPPKSAAMPG